LENAKSKNKIIQMEYPRISALVPEGEHCDMEAMNECIWLSVGHVNSIEVSLEQAQNEAANAAQRISELESTLATHDQAVSELNQSIQDKDAELGHKDAEIEKLNARISELEKKPAGDFSSTTKTEDEGGKPDPKAKYFQSTYNQEALKYAK
jgi:uncharacterized coiled-coil protein SlyX